MAGCFRRSLADCLDASTRRTSRHSPRRPSLRPHCDVRPPRMASTKSGRASLTRTGRTGMPNTWSESRPARSCRHDQGLAWHRHRGCSLLCAPVRDSPGYFRAWDQRIGQRQSAFASFTQGLSSVSSVFQRRCDRLSAFRTCHLRALQLAQPPLMTSPAGGPFPAPSCATQPELGWRIIASRLRFL